MWGHFDTISTPAEYVESLKGRGLRVYLMGELIPEPSDHPMIRPSVNAVAETYQLAIDDVELGSVQVGTADQRINRFLHVVGSQSDLVDKARMQHELGRRTGSCFQRCVGMDALNTIHSVSYEVDQKHGTDYHSRFRTFLTEVQRRNHVIGGAMTDAKGDRSKPPHLQADPDMYLRVTRSDKDGVYLRGAKLHQTGSINSHWLIAMPTMRLREKDADYAIVAAIPVHADGITFIYGRQANDTRCNELGDIDQGNAQFSGQESTIIFEDVFVPWCHVFLHGEYEFAADIVERFTAYHRCSYICKSGVGDVLIGAAAEIADMNGVAAAHHIKDKLVEMVHLNETIRSCAMASAYQGRPLASGAFLNDEQSANVCKHNVTRFPYEIARLAQDIAGGLIVTLPSEADLAHEEIGPLARKYLTGASGIDAEHRIRILRLIENLTIGRNAVGYLTESMHGAGSPQAQRIQIARGADYDRKRESARSIAGCEQPNLSK